MKTILVTGSAGFIGANLVLRLLDSKEPVSIVGLDGLNNYYDPSLKGYRLRLIEEKYASVVPDANGHHKYEFVKGSIADRELVNRLFEEHRFDVVVNLAAQAGVRYSIENPDVYIESNIIGFYNILEACRHNPVSLYAATKKKVIVPTAAAFIPLGLFYLLDCYYLGLERKFKDHLRDFIIELNEGKDISKGIFLSHKTDDKCWFMRRLCSLGSQILCTLDGMFSFSTTIVYGVLALSVYFIGKI